MNHKTDGGTERGMKPHVSKGHIVVGPNNMCLCGMYGGERFFCSDILGEKPELIEGTSPKPLFTEAEYNKWREDFIEQKQLTELPRGKRA